MLKKLFFPAVLLILATLIYLQNEPAIDIQMVYDGWSPGSYVAMKLHPENFKNDFPSGIMAYDQSLPMRIYYYLAKYLHILPEQAIRPMVFLQIICLTFSISYLAHILFKNHLVTILCTTIMMSGHLPGLNLADFGYGIGAQTYLPNHYSFGYVSIILAITFFIQNQYFLTWLFVALAFQCHPLLGIYLSLFILAGILVDPKSLKHRQTFWGLAVFLIAALPQMVSSYAKAGTTSQVPLDTWILQTKIFSHHWYPYTLETAGRKAVFLLVPFLSLCYFFFLSLRYQNFSDERIKKVTAGCAACFAASILSFFLVEPLEIPLLVRMCFQRASALVSFMAVLYIVYYLYRKLVEGNFFITLAAVYTLTLALIGNPGISFLSLFIFTIYDLKGGRFGSFVLKKQNKATVAVLAAIGGMIATLTVYNLWGSLTGQKNAIRQLADSFWAFLLYLNPLAKFDLAFWGGRPLDGLSFLSIFLGLSCLFILQKKRSTPLYLSLICITLILIAFKHLSELTAWGQMRYAKEVKSFINVQRWAKTHTPPNALFISDPTSLGGWREFSERSHFGYLSEWAYGTLCYIADRKSFEEGRRRAKEFGIDLEKIRKNDPLIKRRRLSKIYERNARYAFYSSSADRIARLVLKYGIDYFILEKKVYGNIEKKGFAVLPVAYENEYFIVFGAEPIKSYLKMNK